ncbi:YkgJ family cysteine cluster protein [Novosphingobium sp.]|uniref:YkgJ family cysteine cluster protein n=1 Tax=Novosphingobium sp. TaxID=1874826 RepID=UPI002735062A|nr:YkgJ family cysteine cluster protein [Novosphingobium sp.]MDP3907122.1 YkgJ family cysteine cluster protein [Novosphingobium sp.]
MTNLPAQHAAARTEPFAFRCAACSRCCHHKIIQTNPYEIAQLAALKGVTARAFRERWTEGGAGTALARTEADVCVFLGEQGCTVHPARPLVCRLYPLGRRRAGDGTEHWLQLDPHPLSGGTFGGDGTIADYVEAQQAQPFIAAADAYAEWVNAARDVLGQLPDGDAGGAAVFELLDLDAAIAAHCAQAGVAEPGEPAKRLDMHIALLYAELNKLNQQE